MRFDTGKMIVEEKEPQKTLSRMYLVSMYISVGLMTGGMAISIGLFISGMGEGLILMFPIAVLLAIVLLLHSFMTDKKLFLVASIVILAVVTIVWAVLLLT